jgi:sialidase-1
MMIDNPGIDSTVKLCLQAQGEDGSKKFFDRSQSRNLLTPYGDVQISSTRGKFTGRSIYLDGSGDYISIPVNSSFRFGAHDKMSISVWVNFQQANARCIAAFAGDTEAWNSSTGIEWTLYTAVDTGLKPRFGWWTGSTVQFIESSHACSLDEWHYVTIKKESGDLTMYLNGSPVASASSFTMNLNNSPTALRIGRQTGTGSAYFNGYIDDLVIRNGVDIDGTYVPTKRLGT